MSSRDGLGAGWRKSELSRQFVQWNSNFHSRGHEGRLIRATRNKLAVLSLAEFPWI